VISSLSNRFQHRGDFFPFQVINRAGRSTLDRYGQKTLCLCHLLGIPCGEKACEGMNSRESGIASGDAILSLPFKVIQKGKHIVRPQVL
jgi:hypothetical protein